MPGSWTLWAIRPGGPSSSGSFKDRSRSVNWRATFPVSRPAISQHLRILKHAHLVVDRPEGNRRLYELNPAGVEALRAYFDRFWDHALASYKRAAEARACTQHPINRRK